MGISHEEQTVKLCSVILNRHRCASPQTKEWSKWPCYIFYKQYVSVCLLSYYIKDKNCFACQYTRIQNLLYISIFFLLNNLKRCYWLFSTVCFVFFRGADSFLNILNCGLHGHGYLEQVVKSWLLVILYKSENFIATFNSIGQSSYHCVFKVHTMGQDDTIFYSPRIIAFSPLLMYQTILHTRLICFQIYLTTTVEGRE